MTTMKNFDEIAARHGFGSQIETLRPYLLPCVGFSLVGARTDRTLGGSRFGGGPDVPADFEWPTSKGRRLDFLLQVNLRDIAQYAGAGFLPRSGILSFFYDVAGQPWGYDPANLSGFGFYHFRQEGPPLERRPVPNEDCVLPERALDFWPAWSLPTYRSRAGFRLRSELTAQSGRKPDYEAFHAFHQLSDAVFRAAAPATTGPCHRLGGHSSNIQGDMQLEAQLVTNGLYCGNSTGYDDPRRKELEKSCEDWRLVLQLDSDDDVGLMWGDGGMVYYWARSDDLVDEDFSNAWVTLQCG
jgi:uncharacterized protein YwqG